MDISPPDWEIKIKDLTKTLGSHKHVTAFLLLLEFTNSQPETLKETLNKALVNRKLQEIADFTHLSRLEVLLIYSKFFILDPVKLNH